MDSAAGVRARCSRESGRVGNPGRWRQLRSLLDGLHPFEQRLLRLRAPVVPLRWLLLRWRKAIVHLAQQRQFGSSCWPAHRRAAAADCQRRAPGVPNGGARCFDHTLRPRRAEHLLLLRVLALISEAPDCRRASWSWGATRTEPDPYRIQLIAKRQDLHRSWTGRGWSERTARKRPWWCRVGVHRSVAHAQLWRGRSTARTRRGRPWLRTATGRVQAIKNSAIGLSLAIILG